jgi:hypothetical protein
MDAPSQYSSKNDSGYLSLLVKGFAIFLTAMTLTIGFFAFFYLKNRSFKEEWFWYLNDPEPLTLRSFDFRHPVTEDPQVMLQLTYKMMEANRPIHAYALIHKVFDIADQLGDPNLRADAHYTYNSLELMSPGRQYRFVLEELKKGDPLFKSRGIRRTSQNYGLYFGGFLEAMQLYQSTSNLAALVGTYYRTAQVLAVVGGKPLYRCALLEKARQVFRQISSQDEQNVLVERYLLPEYENFEEQILAEERDPTLPPRNQLGCDNLDFQNAPELLEKGISLVGWGTSWAIPPPVRYRGVQCNDACEKAWRDWLAPIQAGVEVPNDGL